MDLSFCARLIICDESVARLVIMQMPGRLRNKRVLLCLFLYGYTASLCCFVTGFVSFSAISVRLVA